MSYFTEVLLIYLWHQNIGSVSELNYKVIALSSYKLLNDNCKYENKVSSEELSYLKSLLRNRNIVIQKGEKGNTVVIIDKEKYIQGVKNVISGSSKFIPLNIPP